MKHWKDMYIYVLFLIKKRKHVVLVYEEAHISFLIKIKMPTAGFFYDGDEISSKTHY